MPKESESYFSKFFKLLPGTRKTTPNFVKLANAPPNMLRSDLPRNSEASPRNSEASPQASPELSENSPRQFLTASKIDEVSNLKKTRLERQKQRDIYTALRKYFSKLTSYLGNSEKSFGPRVRKEHRASINITHEMIATGKNATGKKLDIEPITKENSDKLKKKLIETKTKIDDSQNKRRKIKRVYEENQLSIHALISLQEEYKITYQELGMKSDDITIMNLIFNNSLYDDFSKAYDTLTLNNPELTAGGKKRTKKRINKRTNKRIKKRINRRTNYY